MTTKRSSRAEIYKKVIQVLKQKDANVYQIKTSLDNELSWDAISNALSVLKEMDFVEQNAGKFSLKKVRDLNPKTYLGLPLSEEQEDKFYSLARRFYDLWPQKPLKKTFLQKMLVTLIEKKDLNLPYGNYLYGTCTIMRFNDQLWRQHEPDKAYDEDIKQIIKEFNEHDNTTDLMKTQYSYRGMKLYNTRLSIDILLKSKITKDSKELLHNNFKALMLDFEKNQENEDVWEYIETFFSIWSRLKKLDEESLEEKRMDIIKTFQSIWELIGTYELYESIRSFYGESSRIYYENEKNILMNTAESHLQNLEEHCPELEKDPELERFRGTQATRHQ